VTWYGWVWALVAKRRSITYNQKILRPYTIMKTLLEHVVALAGLLANQQFCCRSENEDLNGHCAGVNAKLSKYVLA